MQRTFQHRTYMCTRQRHTRTLYSCSALRNLRNPAIPATFLAMKRISRNNDTQFYIFRKKFSFPRVRRSRRTQITRASTFVFCDGFFFRNIHYVPKNVRFCFLPRTRSCSAIVRPLDIWTLWSRLDTRGVLHLWNISLQPVYLQRRLTIHDTDSISHSRTHF